MGKEEYIGAQIYKINKQGDRTDIGLEFVGERKSSNNRIAGHLMVVQQNGNHIAIIGNAPDEYKMTIIDNGNNKKEVDLPTYQQIDKPNTQYVITPKDGSEGETLIINTIKLNDPEII